MLVPGTVNNSMKTTKHYSVFSQSAWVSRLRSTAKFSSPTVWRRPKNHNPYSYIYESSGPRVDLIKAAKPSFSRFRAISIRGQTKAQCGGGQIGQQGIQAPAERKNCDSQNQVKDSPQKTKPQV
jgi:hypothetical protein